MKLSKFAAAIGDEHAKRRQEASPEQRRKVLHEAWLADVYPHWQGPIAVIAKEPGVEAVTHHPVQRFPDATNGAEVARDVAATEGRALDWLVGEVIEVSTADALGVSASVLYALAGDENDCVAVRAVAFHDLGVIWRTIDSSRVSTWTGPLEMVVEKMVEDVGRAAHLLDDMLLAALGARDARIVEQKRQAEEAERKRIVDAAAAEAAAAAEKKRIEEAALVEAQRLEAEAKAEAEVIQVPTPLADTDRSTETITTADIGDVSDVLGKPDPDQPKRRKR